MKKLLFILCFISAINAQFDPPNIEYKGFSKINCLGLIISGIEDEMLFTEIEKLFLSIGDETLSKQVTLGSFTECPLYPLSVQFFIKQNKDGTFSGTIGVDVLRLCLAAGPTFARIITIGRCRYPGISPQSVGEHF